MAYAFSKINSLLSGDPEGQDKVDIFSQSKTGAYNPNQASGRGVEITNTSGDIGAGSGNANAQQVSTPSSFSNSSSSKAALTANMGKTQTPTSVTNASSTLNSQNQALQDAANAYVTTNTKDYNVSDDKLKNAYAGSGDTQKNDFQNVSNILNTVVTPVAPGFEPPKIGVNAVNQLKTNAGIKNLVSQGQDLNYTPGMASFDTAVLTANPEFSNLRKMLSNQQRDLIADADKKVEELPGQVTDTNNANLASSQDRIRDMLDSVLGGLTSANDAEAAAANVTLDAAQSGARAKALADAATTAKANLGDLPVANYIPGSIDDYAPYETVRDDYVGNDFISDADAFQFNNIQGLLGGSDVWTPSAAYTPGDDYSYNMPALVSALTSGAQNTYEPIRANAQSEYDQILSGAADRAAAGYPVPEGFAEGKFNEVLASLTPEYQELWKQMWDSGQKNVGGPSALGIDFDADDFVNAPTGMGARDVLTAEEADKLNKDSSILGTKEQFTAQDLNQLGYSKMDAQKALLKYLKPMIVERNKQQVADLQKRLGEMDKILNDYVSELYADKGKSVTDKSGSGGQKVPAGGAQVISKEDQQEWRNSPRVSKLNEERKYIEEKIKALMMQIEADSGGY